MPTPEEPQNNKLDNWLMTFLGPVAWWFKERWIFAITIFIAVAASPVLLNAVPKAKENTVESTPAGEVERVVEFTQPWVLTAIVVLAIMGALAVLGDKLADRFERVTSEAQARDQEASETEAITTIEASLQHSISEINWLLEMTLRIPFLKGTAKSTQVETIRYDLVKAIAAAIGPGTRATYYTLEGNAPGERKLVNPKHAVTIGRHDRPDRPWVESESLDHEIWNILNRSDSEPPVVRRGEEASGLDWDKVKYACFLSVPVRARSATFGLLSVNSSEIGAIQESERALVLTAARILALIEASHLGPDGARKMLDLSEPSIRLQAEQELADEEDETHDFAENNSGTDRGPSTEV